MCPQLIGAKESHAGDDAYKASAARLQAYMIRGHMTRSFGSSVRPAMVTVS